METIEKFVYMHIFLAKCGVQGFNHSSYSSIANHSLWTGRIVDGLVRELGRKELTPLVDGIGERHPSRASSVIFAVEETKEIKREGTEDANEDQAGETP